MRSTAFRAAMAFALLLAVTAAPAGSSEGLSPPGQGISPPPAGNVDKEWEIPARVALGPGGRDLRIAGDLTEGVADKVRALLAANPHIERVHLTSDGGLVAEATAIGEAVSKRKLSTYVPDVCASACTLIFVRGTKRFLVEGAHLGFHAPYEVGAGGGVRSVDPEPERAAYRAAGMPESFVAQALNVPPSEIWVPDPQQLRDAGIVTEVVGTDRFPDSTLDADPSPDAARSVLLRAVPPLREVDTARLEAAIRSYREGYEAGHSEAQGMADLKRLAATAQPNRAPAGDVASYGGP